MNRYSDEYREANRGIVWIMAWVAIIVVVVAVIGVGAWLFNVASAEPRGQGDAIQKKYSAENWTAAQAKFEDEYQDIQATDRKITVAAQAVKDDPNDRTAKDTLTGTTNYCLTVVGNYNADARKYLARDFRAADLPLRIDNTDPATDCKGN